MSTKAYEFRVEMTCEGCSGAVKRILDRYQGKGVEKYDINLGLKTVIVETPMTLEEIQAILEKCGKEVTFISTKG